MGLFKNASAFLHLFRNENPILRLMENPKTFLFGALAALSIFAGMAKFAAAQAALEQSSQAQSEPSQADYPFRDSTLSDDQRISDLLGRLTLDEKVSLMSGSPKIPRLNLVLSSQVPSSSVLVPLYFCVIAPCSRTYFYKSN